MVAVKVLKNCLAKAGINFSFLRIPLPSLRNTNHGSCNAKLKTKIKVSNFTFQSSDPAASGCRKQRNVNMSTSTHTAFALSVSFISICLVVMVYILILLLRRLSGSKIVESIKLLSIICHVVAIIVLVLDLSHIALSYTTGVEALSGEWIYQYPVMSLADAFYFVEALSLYTLMYVTYADCVW